MPTLRWSTGTALSGHASSHAQFRAIGFQTPLWALANSHRISDLAVLALTGEVDGYVYLGQQTPAFYAKQIVASLVKYRLTLLPPFFGGLAVANFGCGAHAFEEP